MKNLKRILKNQAGMSMIELVVAAGISVIISAAVMQTNKTGQVGMTTISSKMTLNMWHSSVLMNKFNDPKHCMTNLLSTGGYSKTLGGSADKLAQNNDPNPVTYFAEKDMEILGTGGDWRFKSVVYLPFVADSSTAGTTKGRCDAKVTVESMKAVVGAKQQVLTIPINCTLDSGLTTIQSCSASSDGMDSLWTQQLASGTNLEYVFRNGNVMIGSASQSIQAPFEVSLDFPDMWPASDGASTVKPSIKITGDQRGLIFDRAAVYNEGECLGVALDEGGVLGKRNRLCSRGAFIASDTVDGAGIDNNESVAIKSRGSQIHAPDSIMIGSQKGEIHGPESIQIGSKFSQNHGPSSIIIGSTGNVGFESKAKGANSIILGGSNVFANGIQSIATGQDNIVAGNMAMSIGDNIFISEYAHRSLGVGSQLTIDSLTYPSGNDHTNGGSITFGYSVTNYNQNSIVGGSNVYQSGGSKGGLIAVGRNNTIVGGSSSQVFGSGNTVNCHECATIGTQITNSFGSSMVLGYPASGAFGSTKDNQFTATFGKGFQFHTGAQVAEVESVYIDDVGRVGIGKNPDYISGTKPKLYVEGRTDINGDLYVNGTKVGTNGAWQNLTNHTACTVTGTISCMVDGNGIVHLNGYVAKTTTCSPSFYNNFIATLPTECAPDNSHVRISVPHCDGTMRQINLTGNAYSDASRRRQLRPTNRAYSGSGGDGTWFQNAQTSTCVSGDSGSCTSCIISFDGISYPKYY